MDYWERIKAEREAWENAKEGDTFFHFNDIGDISKHKVIRTTKTLVIVQGPSSEIRLSKKSRSNTQANSWDRSSWRPNTLPVREIIEEHNSHREFQALRRKVKSLFDSQVNNLTKEELLQIEALLTSKV